MGTMRLANRSDRLHVLPLQAMFQALMLRVTGAARKTQAAKPRGDVFVIHLAQSREDPFSTGDKKEPVETN